MIISSYNITKATKFDLMIIPHLPQNKPLSEQVCELIETQIINGVFVVGDKLPTENELAEMYQVSRTVIREATKILKEKGLLESFVGKGTFVVDKTDRGIGSSINAFVRMNPDASYSCLLEVRQMLEPEMAAMAAIKASKEQIAEMHKIINLMDRSLEGIDPIEEFFHADYKFHNLLAESTGNPLVVMLMKPLGMLMRNQQQFHGYHVKGGSNKSQNYHKMILEAIKNRDPEAARTMMRNHIQQVYLDIKDI